MSYDNYLRLVETIHHIEAGARITEDWMEEQKRKIYTYRGVFPDLSNVNDDCTDPTFRSNARQADNVLTFLVDEIHATGTFTISIYLGMCRLMKYMVETVHSEAELMEMFGSMSIANVSHGM